MRPLKFNGTIPVMFHIHSRNVRHNGDFRRPGDVATRGPSKGPLCSQLLQQLDVRGCNVAAQKTRDGKENGNYYVLSNVL